MTHLNDKSNPLHASRSGDSEAGLNRTDPDSLRRLFQELQSAESDAMVEYGGDYRTFDTLEKSVVDAIRRRRDLSAHRERSSESDPRSDPKNADSKISASEPLYHREWTSLQLFSRGRTLIVGGNAEQVRNCGERLSESQPCVMFLEQSSESGQSAEPRISLQGSAVRIEGYLGRFSAKARIHEKEIDLIGCVDESADFFDLILDLRSMDKIGFDRLPLGYYAPDGDDGELERILNELPGMIGTFEKPPFIAHRIDVCAHSRSGRTSCNRCVDICPVGAIDVSDQKIRVNHSACVGCGLCATICPTGAVSCLHVTAKDLLISLRTLLDKNRKMGNGAPTIIFHPSADGPIPERMVNAFHQPVLAFPLTEIGCVGPEVWLSALAGGAGRIVLMLPDGYPERFRNAIAGQMHWVSALLDGLDLPRNRIGSIDGGWGGGSLMDAPIGVAPDEFTLVDPLPEKRTLIRQSVGHLAKSRQGVDREMPLPPAAPFGSVAVEDDCTLCLACVGVCPTRALSCLGGTPDLRFFEPKCIQCGSCREICPENAIRLTPRMRLTDDEEKECPRVIHEEEPHACIRCGKVFASVRLVEKMIERLAGHWMYSNEIEIQRLKMCADCRVRDYFLDRKQPEGK